MNDNVIFFWDGPFSQWYRSVFTHKGIVFCTAEQFMMYHKALTMGDNETASMILEATHPKVQKDLGRAVQGFDSKKWDPVKEHIVYTGNLLKFKQNEDLKQILINTKDKLIVEASPYDAIWGIGLSEKEAKNTPRSQWKGQNLLGIALMNVRRTLTDIDDDN